LHLSVDRTKTYIHTKAHYCYCLFLTKKTNPFLFIAQGGRSERDRGYRDYDNDRRGGPPQGYGRGPPQDDHRGGRGGYDDRGGRVRDDYGPPRGGGGGPRGNGPPPMHGGPSGPRDAYGPPRGRGGPPPPPMNNRGGGGGGGGGRRGGDRGGGRRGGGREEGVPGISLLVRNIGPSVSNQDLIQAFGRIGDVRDVYIPRDFHSQQPKGFAFIEYADPERKFTFYSNELSFQNESNRPLFFLFLLMFIFLISFSPPPPIFFPNNRGTRGT
jgi:hypothetical protein